MERSFAGWQITGARDYQEDAQGFAILDEDAEGRVCKLLTVLADGMGGENAGGFASQCVVDTFVDYCHHREDREDVPAMLLAAMKASNEALALAIEKDPELSGMGTTLLVTVVTKDSLYWLSVGDSPLYLYRDGELAQVNEDHSMLPILKKQFEDGYLDEWGLRNHPDRNALRAAMMGEEMELMDCPAAAFPLKPNDILIVASDGLQTLDEDAIKLRLDRHHDLPADGITQKLIKAVERINNPRQDNTSINTICIPDPTQMSTSYKQLLGKTRLIQRA